MTVLLAAWQADEYLMEEVHSLRREAAKQMNALRMYTAKVVEAVHAWR